MQSSDFIYQLGLERQREILEEAHTRHQIPHPTRRSLRSKVAAQLLALAQWLEPHQEEVFSHCTLPRLTQRKTSQSHPVQ